MGGGIAQRNRRTAVVQRPPIRSHALAGSQEVRRRRAQRREGIPGGGRRQGQGTASQEQLDQQRRYRQASQKGCGRTRTNGDEP